VGPNSKYAHFGTLKTLTIDDATGEPIYNAGATWDYIQAHELFKKGLVDVGDVCERLKKSARCDGKGPVFLESDIRWMYMLYDGWENFGNLATYVAFSAGVWGNTYLDEDGENGENGGAVKRPFKCSTTFIGTKTSRIDTCNIKSSMLTTKRYCITLQLSSPKPNGHVRELCNNHAIVSNN
jgi:hypothetical protein